MFEFLAGNPVIVSFVNFITLAGVLINMILFLRKNRLENDEIKIILENRGIGYEAKYTLLRKFVQRSEIKGILRDLLKDKSQHFNIKYLSSDGFIKNIINVQKGNKKDIIIKCSDDEINLFDIEKSFIKRI